MKRKLFSVLFIAILFLSVVGCGKKEETKKIEVSGPRVVCSYSTDSDGIKVDTTVTLKFNSDRYVNYQLLESTMTFDDKDTFNAYADAMKEEDMELGEGVECDYSINKSKKQISTYLIYNESVFKYSEVTEEDKKDYIASAIIKRYEENATCKFIEITQSDLGLE